MTEIMTNEQFEAILGIIRMIPDGCEGIDAAKQKADGLLKTARGKG